jgi:predicted anti-sigma-YlaC factor YlaD
MRCAKTQRWISQRLDGAFDERLEAMLAEHLAECEACRAYAEALRGLDLDLLDVPEPTPDFVARAAERLEETPLQSWPALRQPKIFRPIAAGLGIAAAMGGFAVGSLLHFANGNGTLTPDGMVELAAGDVVDPLAEDSVESVLIAMLPDSKD